MLPNLCGFKVLQSSHAFGLRSRNTAILQDMSKSTRKSGSPLAFSVPPASGRPAQGRRVVAVAV